jgi:hypothetical protein
MSKTPLSSVSLVFNKIIPLKKSYAYKVPRHIGSRGGLYNAISALANKVVFFSRPFMPDGIPKS